MQKKHIVLLHYAAPPTVGGVESTIRHQAEYLARAGYSVEVVAGVGNPFHPDVGLTLIPEVGSRHPEVLAAGQALAEGVVPTEFTTLRDRLVEQLQPILSRSFVCVAHNILTLHKNLALTAAMRILHEEHAVRLIAWSHDMAWLDPLYLPVLYPGDPWDLLRKPWEGVRYVAVSTNNRARLSELLSLPESEIRLIPPGIDPYEFLSLDQEARRLVDRLHLLEADPLILLPARITRRKNIEFAIRVTASIVAQKPKTVLLVTGPPGPHNPTNLAYLESLRNLASDLGVSHAIHFLYDNLDKASQSLGDATVSSLYRIADLLLFPSLQEGFGIPVLEAGLARLPIFAADLPSLKEGAGDFHHSFDPQGDPVQVALAILAYLESDPIYRLKHRVLRNSTWERILKEEMIPLLNEAGRVPAPKVLPGEINEGQECSSQTSGRAPKLFLESDKNTGASCEGYVDHKGSVGVPSTKRWFSKNTYHSRQFGDLVELVQSKEEQELSISLGLPTLNEERTIGEIIKTLKKSLMEDLPLVDEIVLIDSRSTDRTCDIAVDQGIPVFQHSEILPGCGSFNGKGEALWKSLYALKGDLIAWVDADIENIGPHFVYGLLGPLLLWPNTQLVKGFYRRPIWRAGRLFGTGGGRVTELTARPLINQFYPELSGFIQPLSGETAGRRSAFEQVPFFCGYGIETGLLIDLVDRYGPENIAQVDLVERIHDNQPLAILSQMSFSILQVFWKRLDKRFGPGIHQFASKNLNMIQENGYGGYNLESVEISELERPPMITIEAYRQARGLNPLTG